MFGFLQAFRSTGMSLDRKKKGSKYNFEVLLPDGA